MGLDPNYIYDNTDVIWYGTNTYADALGALMKITGKSEEAVTYMLNGQYGAADYYTAIDALRDNGVITAKNTNGYNCFAYADKVTETYPTGPMYQMNSNATATTTVKAAPAYDTVIDDVAGSATEGKVLTNPMGSLLTPEHGFYGWKFFAGECLQAVSAASVGITLGKTIDSALYNLNPDFWDANGMKSLDPTTWNSITNGDDSFAAGLFNMVFGLNPNTGNGQAFIDENAMAYLAYYLYSKGVFSQTGVSYDVPESTSQQLNGYGTYYIPPIYSHVITNGYTIYNTGGQIQYGYSDFTNTDPVHMYWVPAGSSFIPFACSLSRFSCIRKFQGIMYPSTLSSSSKSLTIGEFPIVGKLYNWLVLVIIHQTLL